MKEENEKPKDYLNMSFSEFDQSENGWRELDGKGNKREAANLIEAYIEKNQDQLESGEMSVLYFHLGQIQAFMDETEKAIKAFEKARELYPSEDGDIYTEATIAFLKRDVEKLRSKLEEYKNVSKDRMRENIPIIERLLAELEEGTGSYKNGYLGE